MKIVRREVTVGNDLDDWPNPLEFGRRLALDEVMDEGAAEMWMLRRAAVVASL